MTTEHKPDYDGPGNGQPTRFYDPDMNRAGIEDDENTLAAEVSERKLLLKTDLRIIPVLSVMYLLAFLDRTNIGNAVTFGLQKDLKINSRQYDNALVMFFVSYCVFEIPSNILLKRFRPSRWLSLCMFCFGLVTLCQGLVKSYSGLLAVRFFLGIAETGMFPGSFYVISMYYKRAEAQKRYSLFFASTSLAGAFGGLIAYGIGHLKKAIISTPHSTYDSAWRWIFIIEGAVTCFLAFFWFFLIPDFPEDAKWLTEKERAFVRARVAADQGKSGLEKRVQGHDLVNFFTDYKVYFGAGAYFGALVSAYGYAYFAPTIIKGYHYSSVRTQLISVPPWAASFVFSIVIAYFSDKLRHRFFFCVFPLAAAVAGYAMLLSIHNHRNLQYGALFLVTSGTYGAAAIMVCWFQCNLGGHARRAIGTAWQVGFGNLGGIVSVFIYPSKDAPDYRLGYGVSLAFICFSLLCCTGLLLAYISQNRSRARSGIVEVSHYEELEKGDLAPTYHYML